jgi:hypothetical protein
MQCKDTLQSCSAELITNDMLVSVFFNLIVRKENVTNVRKGSDIL